MFSSLIVLFRYTESVSGTLATQNVIVAEIVEKIRKTSSFMNMTHIS